MANATGITHIFQHAGALRGFHVYSNTENWVPFKGEHLIFEQEYNNIHDEFAVAGKTSNLPGRDTPITVGHVPREISRFVWFAIYHGASITARVADPQPIRSPLVQGGA